MVDISIYIREINRETGATIGDEINISGDIGSIYPFWDGKIAH